MSRPETTKVEGPPDEILSFLDREFRLVKILGLSKRTKPNGYKAEIMHVRTMIWSFGKGDSPIMAVYDAVANYRMNR